MNNNNNDNINHFMNNPLFETFSKMLIEEYLMNKGLKSTLDEFRKESNNESSPKNGSNDALNNVITWYELAMKLHLPDILAVGKKDNSVLENILHALLRESSIRSRRNIDTTLNKVLNTLPKNTILPYSNNDLYNNDNNDNNGLNNNKSSKSLKLKNDNKDDEDDDTVSVSTKDEKDDLKDTFKKSNNKHLPTYVSNPIIKKTIETLAAEKYSKSGKPSSENWVPEIARMKVIERHIAVAKETLKDIMIREITNERENKRLNVTDLQRARFEEQLGATKKIQCGSCCQKFLYVNLPLVVTQKAVLDIRRKWSGLTSDNVFGGNDNNESKKDSRLTAIPRCYDEVRVCVFCAQFFKDQNEYRPSYEDIVYSEKKLIKDEYKAKEIQKNDPYLLVKKDRQLEVQVRQMELDRIDTNEEFGIEEDTQE